MKTFRESLANKRGFTILEVMIAIIVIMIGTLGIINVLQATMGSVSVSYSRLQAVYLVQEGLEIIRNIRDANWLENRTLPNDWKEGLTVCQGTGFIVDYNHSYGPSQLAPDFPCYAGQFLNLDSNGFYNYSSGTQTGFQRKITVNIDPRGLNIEEINVRVEVFWQSKGQSLSFSAEENLYNFNLR